jgi:hypothetical protein
MKSKFSFRPKAVAIGTTILLLICWSFNACKKDHHHGPKKQYDLSAKLTSSQEVPPNNSTATGKLSGSFNSMSRVISYRLSWEGLTGDALNMHFHGPADPGVNAGVQVGITGFPTTPSGMVSGSDTLTEAQAADLLAGKWYVNVHTALYPGGEIRGQVKAKAW